MARTGDAVLRVVEAAYDFASDDAAWLRQVAGTMFALMPASERRWFTRVQITPRRRARIAEYGYDGLTPPVMQSIVDTATSSPPWAGMIMFGGPHGYREFLATLRATRTDDALTKERKRQWSASAIPVAREVGLNVGGWTAALDTDGHGVIFAAFPEVPEPIAPRRRRTLAQLATHVVTALRLRRRLVPRAPRVELLVGGAVLDTSGKVVDAHGAARADGPREALRLAARAIDAARGRSPGEDAVDAWRALVDGRWSLLDTFDSDGRRYFVARPNAPHVAEPRALTPVERAVVAHVARGEATKAIAYALGLSGSRIDSLVASAVRKLGLRSRSQLATLYAVAR